MMVLDQGDCCVLKITETAYLGLCQRPPPRDTPGLLLCFVAEDVDARIAALIAAGAVVDKAPVHHPKYGIYHGFVRDADGHRIEVQRFLDPTWKTEV